MPQILHKWKCPSCGSIQRRKDMPKACPACGYSSKLAGANEIAAPLVGNPKHKSADITYREYERATEANAVAAAEMAGVPVSEMASLKVTNFETTRHEGDLAVKPPDNPVSQFMYQNPDAVRAAQANAMGYASLAHQGKDAHAGAKAFGALRRSHSEAAPAAIAAGQKRLKTEGPAVGNVVTAAPTTEVLRRVQAAGGKATF